MNGHATQTADASAPLTPTDPARIEERRRRREARRSERTELHAAWSRDPRAAPKWITTEAAAAIAGVTRRTITRWMDEGILRAARGQRRAVRVDRDSLIELLEAAAA